MSICFTGSTPPVSKKIEESEESSSDGEPPEGFFEQKQDRPRQSVSAEAYGAYNKMKEYTAPVYPKTPEQRARILAACQKSFMFKALDDKMLDKVISAMQEKTVPAGQTVITQGAEVRDDEAGLYLLEKGKLKVLKSYPKEPKPKHVHTYTTPGDSFGELALLYNCPRAATIVSDTECVVWVLDRAAFNGLVKNACVKKRQHYESLLGQVSVLKSLNPDAKAKLCDVLKPTQMAVGSKIVSEGDEGDTFFIIESGGCEASTKAKGKVMSYKSGDFFGELALKSGSDGLRKATVTCSEAGTLASLDRASFTRLLGDLKDLDDHAQLYK